MSLTLRNQKIINAMLISSPSLRYENKITFLIQIRTIIRTQTDSFTYFCTEVYLGLNTVVGSQFLSIDRNLLNFGASHGVMVCELD